MFAKGQTLSPYEKKVLASLDNRDSDPKRDKLWDAASKEINDGRKDKENKAKKVKEDTARGAGSFYKGPPFRNPGTILSLLSLYYALQTVALV
jgi:hypothetical protein